MRKGLIRFVAISLFFTYSLILHATDLEKFYVFGVGQGNSQLAIYNGFGILYDCGSASQQMHPKLKSLLNEEFKTIISVKKENLREEEELKADGKGEEIRSGIAKREIEIDTIEDTRKSPVGSEDSNTYSNADSSESDVKEVIKRAIDEHQIKHLFVFISHPDSDHYDKLISTSKTSKGEEILPDDIPITIFLCGDWIEKIKQDEEGAKAREGYVDIFKFITRLAQRPNVWIELPFYWNFRGEEGSVIGSYKNLIELFQTVTEENKNQIKYDICTLFHKSHYPNNPPYLLQGDLKTLLLHIKDRDASHAFTQKFEEHFGDIREHSYLRYTYICLMNQRFDNINSQSTIMSFQFPSLKMNFICTGDAHDETFYHGLLETENFQARMNHMKENFYTNILIIPHHGSSRNVSRRMLELFQPDLGIISAGNGKQHGHPNTELIDSYRSAEEKGLIHSKLSFFFDITQALYAISFDRKGETKTGYLHRASERFPLISTNVHGTIKFDMAGVHSNFSDVIEIDKMHESLPNEKYVVNFSQKDSKITSAMKKLRDLKKIAMELTSTQKKRKTGTSEEVSDELISEKISELESEIEEDGTNLGALKQLSNHERITRIEQILTETPIGEDIVSVMGKFYYKIIYKTKKTITEIIYNYYKVKKEPIS